MNNPARLNVLSKNIVDEMLQALEVLEKSAGFSRGVASSGAGGDL